MIEHYWDRWGSPIEAHLSYLLLAAFIVCGLLMVGTWIHVTWRDRHWRRAQKQHRRDAHRAYLASRTTNRGEPA